MDRYKLVDVVGRGSYGVVYKALNLEDGEVVAIKKLYQEHYSVKDCLNMREINSLIDLNNHPNVVKLKDVINQEGIVFLEFEYMDCSLHDLIVNQTKPMSESEIRNMCFQILQGLAYIHHKGYIHRDLKPANLLVSKNAIKISDFGFTRTKGGRPPFTHGVTTPLYRAPEVFLHSPVYDSAVDMWAMGAIMAEMFILKPLFLASSEANVMYNICEVLGTPTETTWPSGLDLASKLMYRFPDLLGLRFSALLPNASQDAVNLIASLLSWDPLMRPTAMDALQHPFFDRCYVVTPSLIMAPMLFEVARERELLKMETYEELVRMLPEHLFDSEIDEVRFEGLNEELVHLLPKHLFDSKTDEVIFEGLNEELVRLLPEHLFDSESDEVPEDSNEELVRLLPEYLFDFEIDEVRFDGSNEELVRMLPEHLFDFEIEEASLYSCTTDLEWMQDPEEDSMYKFANIEDVRGSKSTWTQGFLWRGLSKAWVFCKRKFLLHQ